MCVLCASLWTLPAAGAASALLPFTVEGAANIAAPMIETTGLAVMATLTNFCATRCARLD
jgi:hypothetical protein